MREACASEPHLLRAEVDLERPLHRDFGMLAYDRLFGRQASLLGEAVGLPRAFIAVAVLLGVALAVSGAAKPPQAA